MRHTIRIVGVAAALAATAALTGAAQPIDSTGQTLHRQCAELVWERGGVWDGASWREPTTFTDLLNRPGYCPELSPKVLYPADW